MNELVELVERWSKEKGLDKADSSKQMLKVVGKHPHFSSETVIYNQVLIL